MFEYVLLMAEATTRLDLLRERLMTPGGKLGLFGIVATLFVLALLMLNRIPLSYNLLNLQSRWRTTLMTSLAFTMVISLMTVMLAFVNGMYKLTQGSGQPDNVILLGQGANDETFSSLGFSDVGDIENQPKILREEGKAVSSRETYLVVNQMLQPDEQGRSKRRFMQLRGMDDAAIAGRVHGVSLHEGGKWFSEAGVAEMPTSAKSPPHPDPLSPAPESAVGQTAIEVVLGEGIAREMCQNPDGQRLGNREKDRLIPGDTFELNNRIWLVTGVLKSRGKMFDSEIWGKRSLIGAMFGKESYTSLVIRAEPGKAKELAKFFNEDYTKASLNAQTELAYYEKLSETNKQFLYAIGFVTVILGIGGVFGVMNTMFAAISQRSKDIGVMRLLGFQRSQILVSFLLESIVIALLGGLLGCALGSLCDGLSATSIVSSGQGGGKSVVLELTVDSLILSVGLLLTFLMGLLGGLLPSLNAMRLTALESLR